jgi:hypothetical protein
MYMTTALVQNAHKRRRVLRVGVSTLSIGLGEHRTGRTYPLDHPGKLAGGMIAFTGALPLPAWWGRKSR